MLRKSDLQTVVVGSAAVTPLEVSRRAGGKERGGSVVNVRDGTFRWKDVRRFYQQSSDTDGRLDNEPVGVWLTRHPRVLDRIIIAGWATYRDT